MNEHELELWASTSSYNHFLIATQSYQLFIIGSQIQPQEPTEQNIWGGSIASPAQSRYSIFPSSLAVVRAGEIHSHGDCRHMCGLPFGGIGVELPLVALGWRGECYSISCSHPIYPPNNSYKTIESDLI